MKTRVILRLVIGAFVAMSPAMAVGQTNQPETGIVTFKKHLKGNQSIFAYNFGVPQSPSTELLGLKAGSVSPVASLKGLVGQLGSFAGRGGQAISIDLAPAAIAGLGNDLGRYGAAGKGDYLYRLVRRLQIGVTALAGSEGATPVKSGIAVGGTVSLLDGSDPWRVNLAARGSKAESSTLLQCIDSESAKVAPIFLKSVTESPFLDKDRPLGQRLNNLQGTLAEILQAAPPLQKEEWMKLEKEYKADLANLGIALPDTTIGDLVFKAELQRFSLSVDAKKKELSNPYYEGYQQQPAIKSAIASIKACAKRASELAAYGTDLSIGAGTFWRGQPGDFADLRNGGAAAWFAFRTAVLHEAESAEQPGAPSAAWLFAVSARYGLKETIVTGDEAVPDIRADTLDGWAGIERRSPNLLMSARLGYRQVRANEAAGRFYNREGTRFLLNAQARLTDQMWLGASYGNASGSVDAFNARRFLLTLAFSPPTPDKIAGQ